MAAHPAFTFVQKGEDKRGGRPPLLAYVGSYSSAQGPEGAVGHGQGIYLLEMVPATGALQQLDVFLNDANPSWLAFDPSRTHLYSANEISNYQGTASGSVSAYSIDRATGRLTLLNTVCSEGAGPAYISVHPSGKYVFVANPNGRWFYSLQEEASTLVTFDYDSATGKLTPKQTISTLPKSFKGTNFTSEVFISPDARFLYAANRLHDTIAWFSIDQHGLLTFVGEEWTRGDYPRSFNIDPSGNYLYSCNQRADAITAYRVHRQTGALSFLDQYAPIGTPAAILFLT